MLTYLAIADRYRPRWIVWENVPGVLSSNSGRDFGAFLGGLGQLGYGFAYRVLDAQFCRTLRFPRAVPQRRRRVFVVGYLGDWRPAAAVLFDGESLRGNPAPRREAGKAVACGAAQGVAIRGREGGGTAELTGPIATALRASTGGGDKPHVICANSGETGYCLTASAQQSLDAETETLIAVAQALRGEGYAASEDGTGRGTPIVPVAYGLTTEQTPKFAADHALTLTKQSPTGGGQPQAVAFDLNQITSKTNRSQPDPAVHHTLPATSTPPHLATPWAVRRLTPAECEALQGFSRGFTAIPYRNKPAENCPDGPRYKALGNSMAVPCMEWIGERIALVDARALKEKP